MRSEFVFTLFLVTLSTALAQPQMPQAPMSRPTVSPYIAILGNRNQNGGVNATNLYGIVRPAQQFAQQNTMLQQQLQQTTQNLNQFQQAVASADGNSALVTGKGATFNNLSHYFNNLNGGGGGGFGMGGTSRGFNSGQGAGGTNITVGGNVSNGRNIGSAPQGGSGRRR